MVINNAGLALGRDPVEETSDDYIDRMIDTNVKGLLYMTREMLPLLRKSEKNPCIINIGSVAGRQAYPLGSIYCASKHAVHAISQSLRMELINTHIRVAEILPGLVETEFSLVRFAGDEQQAKAVYEQMRPLKGEDVAEIATFIASRPAHVQIGEVECYPANQASAYHVHRA